MTFPQNKILVKSEEYGLCLSICTKRLLQGVSTHSPKDVQLTDSQNAYWIQKRESLQSFQEYDWTYWTEYCDDLSWQPTEQVIDYQRLSSTAEPVRFFESVHFYEDEIADNGSTVCDARIRVMDHGFFVKLRCFTRVDHQLLKCIETRYYHEFRQAMLLRERRMYQDQYDLFFEKTPKVDRFDVDAIVSLMTVKGVIVKEKYNFI